MFGKIFESGSFIIFRSGRGYVVYNRKKKFQGGHTHLDNFYACKRAIYLVRKNKIPLRSSNYFLESLARLSCKENYINEIKKVIQSRKKAD